MAKKWSSLGVVGEVFWENLEKYDRYRKNDFDQHYRKFCCRQYCLWGEQNRSSGSGDMGKKSGQNNRNANILSNIKVRSKGKVIGNVMADNIVFGSGVLAHHPEELFRIIYFFLLCTCRSIISFFLSREYLE